MNAENPNDMLRSLHESREFIFSKELYDYMNDNDTLYLIEGYSSHTGMTYSTIWSSSNLLINYKSHFGKNVEIVIEDFFDDAIKEKVVQQRFNELYRSSLVHDGNFYIASVVVVNQHRIKNLSHAIFEEPSLKYRRYSPKEPE